MLTIGTAERLMAFRTLRRASARRTLRLTAIVALMAGIFVVDTLTDFEIAVAVFYVAAILVAVGLLPRRGVLTVAAGCVALTVLSLVLTRSGSREAGLVNLAISVAAIGVTTYLALELVTAMAAAHESQARLARLARVTRLGELTASIAHEVNQPLAAVVTSGNACLRWLDQDPPNVENARRSVRRSIGEAERAGEVIARVRSMAGGGAPGRERLRLDEVILEAVELARDEIDRRGIALRVSLAGDLPPVLADPIQLQQVIANLVLNAVEAIADAPAHERELAISAQAGDGTVVVAVADTGAGLRPDARDRLFDAFWTTKEGGLGIGLTICRAIVEAHGGRIWATPGAGAGAVFRFSLPASGGGGG
jgi:C4-dicarboxylate-specific signal transduction histidine kinase